LPSGAAKFLDASKHVESVNLAPDGQRAIVDRTRRSLSVPMKEGTARALTKTPIAHERDAIWSPDGKWIAYNSDESGENELYVRRRTAKASRNS
jgi:tricorn protease